MKRVVGVAALIVLAWAGWLWAQGTPAPGSFRISGPDGVTARVSHYGGLMVTIVGGDYGMAAPPDTAVSHISSVTHVAGMVSLRSSSGVAVTLTGTALDVNCTGCAAASVVSVNHITSVTHVAGSVQLVSQSGVTATLTGTSLDVNCTAGCAGGVNTPVNQSGVWTISAAHVANMPSVAQGGTWTIQSAHILSGVPQSGVWNVTAHIGNTPNTTPILVNVAHQAAVTHVTVGRATLAKMMVANCGTGASTVLQANPSRRRLILQSAGTAHIGVGFGHVTVTIANGWLLYSPANFPAASVNNVSGLSDVSKLDLENYTGPVACIGAGANQRLNVLELIGG